VKLATLKGEGRDGCLVVVDRDLERAVPVPEVIAPTLQSALDNWGAVEGELAALSDRLNRKAVAETVPFDQAACASPLPRAYQWADGSAYLCHVELVRKARGAEMPESLLTEPLMYQGGSDGFLGPREPIPLRDEDWGLDFEAEIAVVTGDVPTGVRPEAAADLIRLVMLANDVSLRNLIPAELAKGFGFFQGKPASAFSPVAVTPDELGSAWNGRALHLPLVTLLNGEPFGNPDAGTDMAFGFPDLVAHAAKTRRLAAGTIVGSGTVSNRDRTRGSSCIAERRMIETIDRGAPVTPYLKFGDRVRIEMFDAQGSSIFGAIDQEVTRDGPAE
jgi:fumarylacetoacetate (FAA) hydrolase